MITNLIEGDLDQTHPLPPLEQLAEHLRDLILIHWENEPAIQNALARLQTSAPEYRSLFLKKSIFVNGGKQGGKSYMLFTVTVSPSSEPGTNPEDVTLGLEFAVRTL
ncbi:MAG: hypothetical protein [Microviridae sp.]|nr:MAG: hypothetical protein [Microviridae sp.]